MVPAAKTEDALSNGTVDATKEVDTNVKVGLTKKGVLGAFTEAARLQTLSENQRHQRHTSTAAAFSQAVVSNPPLLTISTPATHRWHAQREVGQDEHHAHQSGPLVTGDDPVLIRCRTRPRPLPISPN